MQKAQIAQQQEHNPGNEVVAATMHIDGKQPFTPPKLTFIAPKLTKEGSVASLTAGLLGTFSA
jgi:hypothetical protein